MKAISLQQPWASLVAVGLKQVETRSWKTSYRGPLAIHASATLPKHGRRALNVPPGFGPRRMPFEGEAVPIIRALNRNGYRISWDVYRLHHNLPLGAIVATCELVDVISTWQVHKPGRPDWDEHVHHWTDGSITAGWSELAYGDFTPGRFAWILENVQRLEEPVPMKGSLGLWEWKEQSDEAHA